MLDPIDLRILASLQVNARVSNADIARDVDMAPSAILERINREVNSILATPEFRERLERVGAVPVGGSIADFRNRLHDESERWGKVIKFANITP